MPFNLKYIEEECIYSFSILADLFILWVFNVFIFTLIFERLCYKNNRFGRQNMGFETTGHSF